LHFKFFDTKTCQKEIKDPEHEDLSIFFTETKELNGKKLCEWGLAKKEELIITNYVNKEKEQ